MSRIVETGPPVRWSLQVVASLVLVVALVPASQTRASPLADAGRSRPKPLAWPPPRLVRPATVRVPSAAPVTLNLDPGRDYILELGHVQGPGGLVVNGGHNVVIVGGEVSAVSDAVESDGYAMRFYDQTGIVHVEGVLIDGAGDGITIQAPRAVFQIENVRIEIHAYQDNFSYAHPDLIQTWSGPLEVRTDRVTGVSDYQGFTWMKASASASYPARVTQRNVNVQAAWPQPGSVLRWPDGTPMDKPSLGPGTWHVSRDTTFSCQNCWLQTGWYSPHYQRKLQDSMGGWMNDGGGYTQPPYRVWGSRGRNLGRQQGDVISWPTVPALAHEVWRWGRPRGGDFVPRRTVGIHYVSPGYVSAPVHAHSR